MSKWEKVRLGELTELITKGTTPSTIGYGFVDQGINFVKIESISSDGSFIPSKFMHISKECDESMKRSRLKENDILFSIAGALGRTAIVSSDILPANINQALAIIRLKNGPFNHRYVQYALRSDHIFRQFSSQKQGVAQLNLSLKNIGDLTVPIPPLNIQKQIAHALDTVSELLVFRKQQLEGLGQLIKSVFYEMFGNPVTNEKGWQRGVVGDLAKSINYGTSQKATTEIKGVPVLRMNNITYQGSMDYSDLKYIEMSENDKKKYLIYKGQLLFNRTNSKELVGKTAVYKREEPMAFAGYLVRLIPSEKANSEYISGYLNSPHGKKVLYGMAKNIIGMANINARELSAIPILIPPKKLQDDYANVVEEIEAQKALVKQSIDETHKLFDSLMSKYFDD